MRYKLLTLLSNFVAVADQRKERDDSPVPQQMKRYPQETHRQLQPPGETPSKKRIKLGKFQWSVSVHREEAASPTQYM